MTTDPNGTIKLSWTQVVTILGMILALAAAWYDMRSQMAGVRTEIAGMRVELALRVMVADREHLRFEQHDDRQDGRLDRLERR